MTFFISNSRAEAKSSIDLLSSGTRTLVGVVSSNCDVGRRLVDQLSFGRWGATCIDPIHFLNSAYDQNIRGCSFLLVVLDNGMDIYDIVGTLMEFRYKFPDISVVLAFQDFQEDDLSLARISVSDISIKLPFKEKNANIYLARALSNNSEWRRRIFAQSYRTNERLSNV